MGCTNSNVRKLVHQDLPVEERLIESSENLLIFSRRKLEDSLSIIDSITYPIKSSHFLELCDSFLIEDKSYSGIFLKALLDTHKISSKQLKYVSILLSNSASPLKASLIISSNKKELIDNISEVFSLAVGTIPRCLHNIETTALLFSDILKQELDRFIKELRKLPIEKINEVLSETQISSKEIRIKIFYEFKNREDESKIESKLDKFKTEAYSFEDRKLDYSLPEKSEKNTFDNFHRSRCDSVTEDKMIVEVDTEKKTENPNDETILELRNMLNKLPGGIINDLSFFDQGLIEESIINPASSAELDRKMKELEQNDPREKTKTSAVDLYVQKSKISPSKESEKIPRPGRLQNLAAQVKTANSITKPNLIQRQVSQKVSLRCPKLKIENPVQAAPINNENSAKFNTSREDLKDKTVIEEKRRLGSVKREVKICEIDRKQSAEEAKKDGSFEVSQQRTEAKKLLHSSTSRIGMMKDCKAGEDEVETKEAPATRISKIGTVRGRK